MQKAWLLGTLGMVLGFAWACSPSYERNPFLGYTEEYGVAGQQQDTGDDSSDGSGDRAQQIFRRDMTVTLRNNYTGAEANCAFVAWVQLNSIRNADQQDALLRAGYSQLTSEERIGSAIVLPVGTFVYDGGGTAGATSIVLGRALGGEQIAPEVLEITLPTPDGILVFSQPPVSCDTVAFYFTDDGDPLTSALPAGRFDPFAGAYGVGGFKTIAQVSAYQCSPFRPGLYFSSGGVRGANQYLEGQGVTFDFILLPDDNGDAAIVTIGDVPPPISQQLEDEDTGDQGTP